MKTFDHLLLIGTAAALLLPILMAPVMRSKPVEAAQADSWAMSWADYCFTDTGVEDPACKGVR